MTVPILTDPERDMMSRIHLGDSTEADCDAVYSLILERNKLRDLLRAARRTLAATPEPHEAGVADMVAEIDAAIA